MRRPADGVVRPAQAARRPREGERSSDERLGVSPTVVRRSKTRAGLAGLTLLEVMIALTLLTLAFGVAFGMLLMSSDAAGLTSRATLHVQDELALRDRLLRPLSEAPYVPSTSYPSMPTTLPVGWPAGSTQNPHIVVGAGSDPDELYFMTVVARDTDGDGLLDADERGLGAADVLNDYYRVRVSNGWLVRDLVDGATGLTRRSEVVVHSVDDALAPPATASDAKPFTVFAVTTPEFFLRVRQGFAFAGRGGREVARRTLAFNFTMRRE